MSVAMIRNIGGGVKLEDINPNQSTAVNSVGHFLVGASQSNPSSYYPIKGYKKISLRTESTHTTITYAFSYADGTESTVLGTLSSAWTQYIDIPSNVLCLKLNASYSTSTFGGVSYSLLA